jgi:peptidoglycan hydrolase CwlO-like protein
MRSNVWELLVGIAIILIAVVNIMQSIYINDLEKQLDKQDKYVEEFMDTQKDMEEDINRLEDVLLTGTELGTFTATYYCA